MHRDRDFDPQAPLPSNAGALRQDLGLDVILETMAAGDEVLLTVVRTALLRGLERTEEIAYRQSILSDCLAQPAIVRKMYAIACEALARERKVWGWTLRKHPSSVLHRSLDVMEIFLELLMRLRRLAEVNAPRFRSEGLTRLLAMLVQELDDEYLAKVREQLSRLRFEHGVRMSARLGEGSKATDYVLHVPRGRRRFLERVESWIGDLSTPQKASYVYEIAERDEGGFRALEEIRNRGIALVADRLGQAADHVLSFFSMLRIELGFYVGCLNLRDRLLTKDMPLTIPEALSGGETMLRTRALYDVSLALSSIERVVGNDVAADQKRLVIITGANRGGKTTFLRSLGQAQLMTQCGMFVAAEQFRASLCSAVFTHFKREEDAQMRSGKLDEELGRMSAIVDHVRANGLVLLNESFSSTNEREGSEIARQVVQALLEGGVRICYVTHLFDLARSYYLARVDTALFLRAERLPDGRRTFRLLEGEPLTTSFGADLYRRIFGAVSVEEVRPAAVGEAGP